MALVRWDPFRELTALQTEVNRLFSRVGGGDVAERQSWTPSIDVIETDDAIKLKAELAGMDPKDISIEVQDNVLTVSGERRFEEEVKEDKYYRIERRYGSFSRSLALPQTVGRGRHRGQVRERRARGHGAEGRDRQAEEDHGGHRRGRRRKTVEAAGERDQVVDCVAVPDGARRRRMA